jgi:hypothetical protein
MNKVGLIQLMLEVIREDTVTLYNETLHPMFWPNGKLDVEVRKQLLRIANDFLKELDLGTQVIDVRFLGSLAGYNYTQESDIDLHVTLDLKKLGIPEEQILRFGKGLSSKWNEDHNVQIKGHKVEIFVDDISAKNRASGIYSLVKDQWIRVPQKQKVQFDKPTIKQLYSQLSKQIDDSIATNSVQGMRAVMKQITGMREKGLRTRGEFSSENIVFKILRAKGHIGKLKDAINSQLDKEMSLSESGHSSEDYDEAADFCERRDEQLYDLASLLKQSQGKGHVPWKTIPASLLKKVWFQFGKYNRVNENDIDKIADQILTLIARLQASTEMMGHTQHDVRPELADNGYEFTDEEWDDWMTDYFTNDRGSWMLSDYGLEPLKRIYSVIFNAKTPEEKFYACDKALNVVHQRSDLASMFVEGGSSTLSAIASQGGYSAGEDYGAVNRAFLKERGE